MHYAQNSIRDNMDAIIAQTTRFWAIPKFEELPFGAPEVAALLKPWQDLQVHKSLTRFWHEVFEAQARVNATVAMRIVRAYNPR